MWRWSLHACALNRDDTVFSTHVEVILIYSFLQYGHGKYSPHMWRWSWLISWKNWKMPVFSTHVEVILMINVGAVRAGSILHTCGGDPIHAVSTEVHGLYSPHMWRWSSWYRLLISYMIVFSTHVEVILSWSYDLPSCKLYSPHMWRWS